MTALLVRNPALTHEQFVKHWLGHHGPLVAGTPAVASRVRRYEQHLRVPQEWAGATEFDGMTVQWLDSVDDVVAFTLDPEYEAVKADEDYLLDRSKLVWMMSEVAATPIAGVI